MESFEYAIKKDVRNNPIVREIDQARQRGILVALDLDASRQRLTALNQ